MMTHTTILNHKQENDVKTIFSYLDKQSLALLAREQTFNHYKKGQSILTQGMPVNGLHYINRGKIKITSTGMNGKEAIIQIISEGDILGLKNLLLGSMYAYSTTVIEETRTSFVPKHLIHQLIKTNTKLSFFLMSKLSEGMNSMEKKIASFTQKNVRQRFAELLVLLAQTYGSKEHNRITLNIKLTREEMASIIGTAPENLMRLIKKFKNERLISETNKILSIEDLNGLKYHALLVRAN